MIESQEDCRIRIISPRMRKASRREEMGHVQVREGGRHCGTDVRGIRREVQRRSGDRGQYAAEDVVVLITGLEHGIPT